MAELVSEGWHRNSAIDWPKATLAMMRSQPDSDEVREVVRTSNATPDLWRIVQEDGDTPGEEWNYSVQVLECLYLTTRDAIPRQQRIAINAIWWAMDDAPAWYLRVWCLTSGGLAVQAFEVEDFHNDLRPGEGEISQD